MLKAAGYRTTAVVDNPNVAASLGYAKGFDRYRETWDREKALATEMDRARAITADAVQQLGEARPEQPFLLWLHYVNPHAPVRAAGAVRHARSSTPRAAGGRPLRAVNGFHGGVPRQWARAGRTARLVRGAVRRRDRGRRRGGGPRAGRAGGRRPCAERTLVVITSDHGESLGEHDYYFDHGEDLFDPSPARPADRRRGRA